MNPETPRTFTRREFLKMTLRIGAVAGLLLMCYKLGLRRGGATLPRETCPSGGACGSCPRLATCNLPRGITAKTVIGKQ